MKIKQLADPNFVVFCLELEQAVQEGYTVDMTDCPCAGHRLFTANLTKLEEDELPKKAGRPFSKKVG